MLITICTKGQFLNVLDSVTLIANHARPGADFLWEKEMLDCKTGLVTKHGHLKNLRLRMDQDGRLGISGSFPKYFHGSNVDTFTRGELIRVIEELAGFTGIDPDAARVYRLDLAATLPMKQKAVNYFRVLGQLSRFTRKPEKSSLLYKSKQRSLTFYDKGIEAKVKGDLLRIELKLKSRLRQQVGFPVFLSDLHDKEVFEALVYRWQNQYKAVQKIKRHLLTEPMNVKDLREQLARLGVVVAGGQDEVLEYLDRLDLDYQTKKRCKSMVCNLSSSGNSEDDATLIEELDQAVEIAVEQVLDS